MDYADSKLTDVYPERELTRIPAAPRDIDHPEFPVPVLQRDSEIAAFEGRVGKVLLHAQVPKYGACDHRVPLLRSVPRRGPKRCDDPSRVPGFNHTNGRL